MELWDLISLFVSPRQRLKNQARGDIPWAPRSGTFHGRQVRGDIPWAPVARANSHAILIRLVLWATISIIKKNKDGGLGVPPPPPKEEPSETSRYWAAHLSCAPIRGNRPGISERCNISSSASLNNNSRPDNDEVVHQAKKAKVATSSSKHVQACRGQCPAVWTIDNYCPYCHG